jgi:hypothetical protein
MGPPLPFLHFRCVVTVRFTFSQVENQHAMAWMALRSRAAIAMLGLGAALLAAGGGTGKTVLLLVGAAELFCWLVLVVAMPRLGSRRMTEGSSEQRLSFCDEGVTAANASGEGSFDWRHWSRWSSAGDLYVLWGARRKQRAFTFIPRRAFADAAAESEFRELLDRHIGSPRRR